MHPDVLKAIEVIKAERPDQCAYAWGAVDSSATKPRPVFCARKAGHRGGHQSAEMLAERRKAARDGMAQLRAARAS